MAETQGIFSLILGKREKEIESDMRMEMLH